MPSNQTVSAYAFSRIEDIGEFAWQACSGAANPFIQYAFLRALEASGSASAETGWLPQHLAIGPADGDPVAVMPLYLKSHSFGEYVFDHAWADAYERAGGRYYPKLQSSVPFTPATGPRLLVTSRSDGLDLQTSLLDHAIALADQRGLSSLHLTFLTRPEADLCKDQGLLIRKDQQFHWHNKNYPHFQSFLDSLSSRKRKNIRKEREEAVAAGVSIERLTGNAITEAHWDHFFEFYLDTAYRKWGQPYLNREFFSRIGDAMADRILLIMCRRNDQYIAGALHFLGGDTLYGRYWGCSEHHRFLHFEACYYQAIEFAIENQIARVEAGAQGPHKLSRGYEPIITRSAHWIANPAFRDAVVRYLSGEQRQIEAEKAFLEKRTPFRRNHARDQ